jgi:hypothetical protein
LGDKRIEQVLPWRIMAAGDEGLRQQYCCYHLRKSVDLKVDGLTPISACPRISKREFASGVGGISKAGSEWFWNASGFEVERRVG